MKQPMWFSFWMYPAGYAYKHGIAESGEVDFVEAVAAPLPIAVIGWLLGVPEADWPKLYDWTNRMIGFDDPEFSPTDLENEGTRAMIELFTYFAELVEERRAKPQDDLISLFTHAEVDGVAAEQEAEVAVDLSVEVVRLGPVVGDGRARARRGRKGHDRQDGLRRVRGGGDGAARRV